MSDLIPKFAIFARVGLEVASPNLTQYLLSAVSLTSYTIFLPSRAFSMLTFSLKTSDLLPPNSSSYIPL